MRIIVLGYIVRGPLAGFAWHHAQYVVGLSRLGHDVYFLEDSEDYPCCYDPSRNLTDADPRYGLWFAGMVFGRLGLKERWAYFDAHQNRWHGPAGARAEQLARGADVVLDLSGVNPLREWLAGAPVRVLIDTDPVFTQVRNLTDPWFRARTDAHNRFFSFGENLGRPACDVPADGIPWLPTRQPVCTHLWPVTTPPSEGPWTTVMQWDSYAKREHAGRSYGMKSASFAPYVDLPARLADVSLVLAMGGGPHANELAHHGWRFVNPLQVTRDPWTYQAFIQQSRGEWSVAKEGYARTGCGWFSERTCSYLASGRPAVVQETGWSRVVPAGAGALAFTSLDQAVEAVRRVERDYAHHCRAARALVEEHFAAEKVLAALLARL